MKTTIHELSLPQFLRLFGDSGLNYRSDGTLIDCGCETSEDELDEGVHWDIQHTLYRDGVDAVVCFENLDMSSNQLGRRTAMAIGPDRTYKTVDAVQGKHLGDVPSRFQWPVAVVYREPAKR